MMKIKWEVLHDISSSRATWKNLSTSSSIEWTRLNGNDLHPNISSESLIEDEEAHRMFMPNFAYIYACSSTK